MSGVASFVSKVFLPTAKHSADFIKKQYESAVTFVVNDFVFPTYLQEKLQQIGFCDSLGYKRQFLEFVIGKTSSEYEFEEREKNIINSGTNRVTVDTF